MRAINLRISPSRIMTGGTLYILLLQSCRGSCRCGLGTGPWCWCRWKCSGSSRTGWGTSPCGWCSWRCSGSCRSGWGTGPCGWCNWRASFNRKTKSLIWYNHTTLWICKISQIMTKIPDTAGKVHCLEPETKSEFWVEILSTLALLRQLLAVPATPLFSPAVFL